MLHACPLVQRKKRQEKQVGELALLSAPTVCQALHPARQMHELISVPGAENCQVCFGSSGPGMACLEPSAWHVESREWEELNR